MLKESKIKSIKCVGKRLVADITVEDDHSYFGNGVCSHNSSKAPNLQNVPRSSNSANPIVQEVVGSIKKMFIPREGNVILAVDYSQAELRVAASFAKETTMLTAYNNNEDLHTTTAMSVANLNKAQWEELTKDDQKFRRTGAKAGNFGLLYGMGVEGFMNYAKNNYGVVYTTEEATKYRNNFFKTYSNLLHWHEDYKMRGRADGFVRTLFGRKRHLPEIHNPSEFKRAEDERVAVNSPVQGTAGEFTIFAINLLALRLPKEVKLINTVHDSIMFDCPPNLVKQAVKIIVETCENLPIKDYFGVELRGVGMKVDVEISEKSWKDLKPYEEK